MGLLFIFIKLMTLSDIFLQSFRFKPQTACVRKQGLESELSTSIKHSFLFRLKPLMFSPERRKHPSAAEYK